MNNSFEHMQKLAFGKVVTETKKEVLTENTLKDKIKELVHSSLGEAKKKKKEEDVAPQEDVDLEMDATEEIPDDTMAPESVDGADIDPTVKSIQDSLQKAFAQAKTLGDEKLIAQIGNTITMLVRTQVLGGQQGV
jgi:fructose-specific component phosphotransferase system IIB-like protein